MNLHGSSENRGYTLIEMMAVVGIVGMTAAAAVPSVVKRLPHQRLGKATWQVFMDLNRAKARAVSDNVPVVISVNNTLEEYSVWADVNHNGLQDTGETKTTSLSTIPGADLYAYPTTATFQPSGTLSTGSYYLSLRVTVPNAGTKYVYAFPNGHIDGYRIQDGS